jgi:peptide/nickel transport system permease protein
VSEAIASRDYAVVQGFVLVIAIGYLFINLIVDISYAFLDPRIRLS